MESLAFILVALATGARCQAAWKGSPLPLMDTQSALRVSQLQSEVGLLRQELRAALIGQHQQNSQSHPSGGAMYTRWGRTNCTDGIHTELVYRGYAGGTHYTHSGGASDYLCMPRDPQWGSQNGAKTRYFSDVWGAEYEMASFPFSLRSSGSRTLQNHNVPCAVCRAKTRASVLMVPARQECHEGWTREYSGYLTSGYKGHAGRFQYACMDAAPEVLAAGHLNEDGALFYHVEGVCGSLPCPPYINGRELTCVVCTK